MPGGRGAWHWLHAVRQAKLQPERGAGQAAGEGTTGAWRKAPVGQGVAGWLGAAPAQHHRQFKHPAHLWLPQAGQFQSPGFAATLGGRCMGGPRP
jgi:hypothetical protein